ncbi:hypothetical protein MSAN_01613100 [Mycena sanguinolenta]|uniref:Uncharacterized protein n=1 Tax=Mycena sanguinolenta TaxID=230812 RepID=A0A8H6Y410_9AGAR|nr:hypothetical protein MSAN_01613100 [Mycena sanguinolenta]
MPPYHLGSAPPDSHPLLLSLTLCHSISLPLGFSTPRHLCVRFLPSSFTSDPPRPKVEVAARARHHLFWLPMHTPFWMSPPPLKCVNACSLRALKLLKKVERSEGWKRRQRRDPTSAPRLRLSPSSLPELRLRPSTPPFLFSTRAALDAAVPFLDVTVLDVAGCLFGTRYCHVVPYRTGHFHAAVCAARLTPATTVSDTAPLRHATCV